MLKNFFIKTQVLFCFTWKNTFFYGRKFYATDDWRRAARKRSWRRALLCEDQPPREGGALEWVGRWEGDFIPRTVHCALTQQAAQTAASHRWLQLPPPVCNGTLPRQHFPISSKLYVHSRWHVGLRGRVRVCANALWLETSKFPEVWIKSTVNVTSLWQNRPGPRCPRGSRPHAEKRVSERMILFWYLEVHSALEIHQQRYHRRNSVPNYFIEIIMSPFGSFLDSRGPRKCLDMYVFPQYKEHDRKSQPISYLWLFLESNSGSVLVCLQKNCVNWEKQQWALWIWVKFLTLIAQIQRTGCRKLWNENLKSQSGVMFDFFRVLTEFWPSSEEQRENRTEKQNESTRVGPFDPFVSPSARNWHRSSLRPGIRPSLGPEVPFLALLGKETFLLFRPIRR